MRSTEGLTASSAGRNLEAILKAEGCTFGDVLEVTSFHTDPESQSETVLEAKDEVFSMAPYPAWTAVGVTWLSGSDFEIKVEPKTSL